MIRVAHGLSVLELDALLGLQERTLAVDGGRLKLELAALRRGGGTQVLWQQDDRLLGFLGVYAFGPPGVELAGMVDPAVRGRGIGAALLDAALQHVRDRSPVLLLVPRGSAGGLALAQRHGGVLEHSEHALVLDGPPAALPGPKVSERPACPDDAPEVARLLTAAFGRPVAEPAGPDLAATLVAEVEGVRVGTLRLTREGSDAAVHGFVIDPPHQGRGLGREVLRQACLRARHEGAQRVRLEVAVDNERALGLYTSLGFAPVLTEDYWQLPYGCRAAIDIITVVNCQVETAT
ncbi:MAG: GNAT family N-acetyltransferase [Actinomycetota bacterium]